MARSEFDHEQDGPDFTAVDHVKLFRNLPALRFEGRIHEQILPAINRLGGTVAWTDIFVVHSGSDHSVAHRVIALAVRLVVEDGLPYRAASWHLWRDHRVFVPYATIQNWVEAGGKKGG